MRQQTVSKIVDKVRTEEQYIRMGSVDEPDAHAATSAIETLEAAVEEIRHIRTHECRWTTDGYCRTCGADGAA